MNTSYLTLKSVDINNKIVLIRSDLNVPLSKGNITNENRIVASLPTYEYALNQGAKIIIMSHLGRPTEGVYEESFSLKPVVENLQKHLGVPVKLVQNWLEQPVEAKQGEVVLLENVRFNIGEKACDEQLSRKIAKLCDVFVMDAFATAHRAQASTYGVGQYALTSCAGPLLESELKALDKISKKPDRPLLAIIGGAKVSSKLLVFKELAKQCDQIIPGGGIANTFLEAAGFSVGASLFEVDYVEQAKEIMNVANIPLPVDVVVAKQLNEQAQGIIKSVDAVNSDDMILDIGPKTREHYAQLIMQAKTVLCNGPVGVFEFDQFGEGTHHVLQAISDSNSFSVAGGGDTIAAIDKYNLNEKISYISTGGGAFLEFMEGKELPAVSMLKSRV